MNLAIQTTKQADNINSNNNLNKNVLLEQFIEPSIVY